MRVLLIALCLSCQLFAANINDPQQILKKFETQMQNKTFASMHPCKLTSEFHQTVENFEIACDENSHFCTSIVISSDEVTKKDVRQCGEDFMQILTTAGDLEFYTEEDFQDQNKNYITSFLQEVDELLGYRANITLSAFKKGKMTLGHLSGHKRRVDVYNIFGSINFIDMNHREEFVLSTSADIPAPLQVMRFRIGGSNFLRLLDYKKD